MSILLHLPEELAARLTDEAARENLPLEEYVIRLLTNGHQLSTGLGNGSDLVAYWRQNGLIGTRPDIQDSAVHARAVRQQAERRPRN